MIFGDFPIAKAEGVILAHAVRLPGLNWSKGRKISSADVSLAQEIGLHSVIGARLEVDDIEEDAAAAGLASFLCGAHLELRGPSHGRVNIFAQTSGLLLYDRTSIDAVNAVDEAIGVGVLAPFARVQAGDIVATCKIIPFAIPRTSLTEAQAAAQPIALKPFASKRVVLIQTRLSGTADKVLSLTESVTRQRVEALGSTLTTNTVCNHVLPDIAALLQSVSADLVLIAGATATTDRADTIPCAIVAAGGRIERLGMPVDPGNLLCLGTIGAMPVIVLPGCARSPKRNGFDWVLERLLADIPTDSDAIAAMGSGGLLSEVARPLPRRGRLRTRMQIGAIVLAAGRSLRMGSNKLLAELNGSAVIAHVLQAIAGAGMPPPCLVLGATAIEVQSALADAPHFSVVARDADLGMSQSLRAGICAVPAAWQAAMICLGDMPQIQPATLARLCGAVMDQNSIVVPIWQGKRGNPVIWGRTHFDALVSLSGDVGGKALMATLAEHIIEVEVDDIGILADIDTPEALARAQAQSVSASSPDG